MTNLPDLAIREAALKTLADAVLDELKTVKAEMQEQLEATGASRVDATLPDGTKVATISKPSPKAKAEVVDEDLFLKWAREHSPANVTTRLVTEVRPAYITALLAELTAAGTAEVADKDTGEVAEVAGVAIGTPRATTHSVRPVDGGREAIAEAWRNGTLAHLNLPELGAGRPSGTEDAS